MNGPHADSMSAAAAMAPVHGLILAGGSSSRMHQDKAALRYQGRSQLDRALELAGRHVSSVFVSVRANQTADPMRARRPMIVDSVAGTGPIVGIRSALAAHPEAAWLVLACDLPFLSDAALSHLLRERDAASLATAYRSAHDGLPEPLCAIWEPAAAAALADVSSRRRGLPAKISHAPCGAAARALGPPCPRQRQHSRGVCAGVGNA